MARGGRRSADAIDVANTLELDDMLLRELSPPAFPSLSRVVEFLEPPIPFDRRYFNFGEPERFRLGITSGEVSRGRAVSPKGGLSHRIAFRDPSTVAICYRRKSRREVLFAKRRMRGGSGSRRRTWRSDIKC